MRHERRLGRLGREAARRRRQGDGRVLHRRLRRGEPRRAEALERVAGRQGDHRPQEGRDGRGRRRRAAARSSSRSWRSRRRSRAEPARLAAMVCSPKRFPDRDDVAAVLAEAEPLEPGGELGRRRGGSPAASMARREMGKLVFLDLVDRSGRIQLICDTSRTGELDLAPRRRGRRRRAPAKSQRGEPSLARRLVELLARNREPAAGHVPRPDGRRAPLPQALPRSAR